MSGVPTRPVDQLVPHAKDYLTEIVLPAVSDAAREPANSWKALAAFNHLFHTKDWALRDGIVQSEAAYWQDCPFAQVIGEIANGGKHASLKNPRYTASPHVLGFKRCGFGEGGWGVGPFGVTNIQVNGIRHVGEDARWWSLKDVLTEASEWWKKEFGIT